ncbi:MAG: hypothetical protein JXJ20_00355 [Anaerolineae bacterium]|jgi:hypothetical protein|nr:hypothetical protein [Anaerolineae bacterium]
MDDRNKRAKRVTIAGLAVLAIGSGHLVEDFLYGVHTGFGLSDAAGQVLTIVYFAVLGTLIVLASHDKKAGYVGCIIMGAFLALADTTYHMNEILYDWPYRAGVFSKALIIALIFCSLALTFCAWCALQSANRQV